ncbi:MAG TPA: type 4a pilus biogenesis protein PilO [Actinomycetota bacterium]|nr:type 4a pilus biogenesis protein PilO [Actinomycetota bacterium]
MSRRGPVLAAVAGLALVLLMVAFVILPKASQVREKRREVDVARQQEAELKVRLDQLRALAQEAPKNRRRLRQLDAAIPPNADLPGLIRLLNGIAEKSAVDFMSVAPSTPAPSPFAAAVLPIQITVSGRFFSVDQYLYRLENLPRAAKVTTISVTPGGAGGAGQLNYLQVSLQAEFYTMDTTAGPGTPSDPNAPSGQTGAPGTTATPAPGPNPPPNTATTPAPGAAPAPAPSPGA